MMRSLLLRTVSHVVRSGQFGGTGGFGFALYRRGMSLLARLAIGGMVAAIAGIVIGALATGGGFVQLLVTAFATMALWLPAFFLVSRVASWRRRRQMRAAVSAPANKARVAGPPRPADAIDASWNRLAMVAGQRHSEVRRIEGQLAEVWRALPAQSLDPQVHELQLLIGQRIPQLIDTQLSCLPLRSRERGQAVDELLNLLGDFTQDSVGRYERLAIGSRHQHEIVRRRIEDHLGRNGLSSLS